MTFSDFSITVSKNIVIQNGRKFVYLLTTSKAEPDVNPIEFVT